VNELEKKGASVEELSNLLGRGRAKKGMFEGDLVEGELEIGQVSGAIDKIQTVKEVVDEIVAEYNLVIKTLEGNYL
jgi:enoyl-[acyl-carrier protein] reductase II